MPSPDPLKRLIENEMEQSGGRIPFRRFMELALYAPTLGYYTSDRSPVGANGDFMTSVSTGPVFGRILAAEIRRLRTILGNPPGFRVVEFGGHRGQLRHDILAALPDLDYIVVEVGDTPPESVTGVVLSNEFVDALPFHRVVARDGAWQELFVARDPATDGFREVAGPLSTDRLSPLLADLPADSLEGFHLELRPAAADWLRDVAARLARGYVITIDYGFTREELLEPHRAEGTMQCYRGHQRVDDPYADPGKQDITCHVNFSDLIDAGRAAGLQTVEFIEQGRFLLRAGEEVIAQIVQDNAGKPSRERNAIHALLHPSWMGAAFRVLVQRKD